MPDPSSVQWRLFADGFTQPLDLQASRDGRFFVVEQPGIIRVMVDGEPMSQPFLDLRDRVVRAGNEQGLLGLAFHPNFDENGYFYVNYTGAGDATHVARFNVGTDPNIADPDSETTILSLSQPYRNHNGGGLAFGPDGMLYIGTGDGGSAGDPLANGQRLDTLLGKILRIEVNGEGSYAVPEDNPFFDVGAARPEIWDYGLRNPWRFSFDPATEDLYIADVGQNQWEEINFEAAASGGINYGWNAFEGSHAFAGSIEGTTFPVAEYSHGESRCSVTGGLVVRDPSLPLWQGVYLYGDFCSGHIWGLLRQADGSWVNQVLFDTSYNITTFGMDSGGHVYLADRGGAIYRLTAAQ
jgi:glucose/arabinose dehydrogenase